MDDESEQRPDVKKRVYKKPALRIYGLVRELTGGVTGSQSGDAASMVMAPSDRRVKRNIVRVGDHPLGIGLYLFDYDPERRARYGHGRQFGEWTLPDGTRSTELYRIGSGYLLRFPGLADFEISAEGLAVRCRSTPETSDATSRHLYLNQVLPLVLGQLGKMVFHASAVEIARGALAFV